jgi:hypothetical protein
MLPETRESGLFLSFSVFTSGDPCALPHKSLYRLAARVSLCFELSCLIL